MSNVIRKEDVQAVYIQLDVHNEQSLVVMLAADGAINRLGRGTLDNDEHDLYQGFTEDRLFECFMLDVDDNLFQYAGRYRDESPSGEICKLTMQFHSADESTDFEFIYGAESQGPPTEFCDLVITSVDLTDPWFEKQIAQRDR